MSADVQNHLNRRAQIWSIFALHSTVYIGTAEQTPETYIKDRGVLGKERRGDWVSELASLATQ